MLLVLDVGNTQIYGGVFEDTTLKVQFRKSTQHAISSDELGLFLKTVLRENVLDPAEVKAVAICSVVPDLVHTFRNCCLKYFHVTPFFLHYGVKTGLEILYRNPLELGSDRITNAIAATQLFPNENLVIIDFGTAIKFCAVNANGQFLGGAIAPGLRIAMEALEAKTARLPNVEIVSPKVATGRSTVENIQSGLFYGTIGMVREITTRMISESFANQKTPQIIGTGGFSGLFADSGIFNTMVPDLILRGLMYAYRMNS